MMSLRKRNLLRVFCVFMFVALLGALPLFAATEEMEITGMVYASDWDANGNVTGVLIETEEGEQIAVANSGKGMELLQHDEKSVKATGLISLDDEGRKTISVTRYIVQKEEPAGSF